MCACVCLDPASLQGHCDCKMRVRKVNNCKKKKLCKTQRKEAPPLNLESAQAQAVGGEDKKCGAGAAPIGPQRSISSDELARMAPLGSGTLKSQCSSTHCAATDDASDEQD
jgi:hypothetical protein